MYPSLKEIHNNAKEKLSSVSEEEEKVYCFLCDKTFTRKLRLQSRHSSTSYKNELSF